MAKVYKFKVTLPGNKIFFREYEIKGDTTLFALHKFLVNDLEFAPDQMFAFKGFTKDSKAKSTYGLINYGSGTVDRTTVDMALEKGEEILLYIYDIKKARFLQLTLIEEVEVSPRASYPRVTGERGRLPSQFSSNKDVEALEAQQAEGEEDKEERIAEEDDGFDEEDEGFDEEGEGLEDE